MPERAGLAGVWYAGRMIRNVLFDIGVVLLHIHYKAALLRIVPRCSPLRLLKLAKFLTLEERDPIIAEYERGRVTTADFFRHFVELTGYRGTQAQFVAAWRGILSENTPMLEFGRELSRTYSVYLVTNTGELQVPHIYDSFPAIRFFKDQAASFELGEVKPDRAFYEKALAKFGITADTCLFIDDRPENIAGARACGLQSIQYTTATETIAAVRAALSDR